MQPEELLCDGSVIEAIARRPLALVRRRDEDLEPVTLQIQVKCDVAGQKLRRSFPSDEAFLRFREHFMALTAKFEKRIVREHPVPIHAWWGMDLFVILGDIEELLPLPSQTRAILGAYSSARDLSRADVRIETCPASKSKPARTQISLSNGSGFSAHAEMFGQIPSRALMELAGPPCSGVRVEMVLFQPEVFKHDRLTYLPRVREVAERYRARQQARAEARAGEAVAR